MGSHSNCTLQIKLIQLRLRCSDEKIASWFKEIKSFKMKVNRKYQQLWCSWKTWIFTHGSEKICATKFLSGSVTFLLKTRLLKSNLCSRRNMSSNTEISSSYWQVSIFFLENRVFWFKQQKASFWSGYFSTRLWSSTKILMEQSSTVVRELYMMTYRYELEL